MRLLPSGSTSLLIEVDGINEVLALYAALVDAKLDGVIDLVPAASTVLLVIDPTATSLSTVTAAVRTVTPRRGDQKEGERVEVPVTYDGEDLEGAAQILGCDAVELIRRHKAAEWTVAFCGFIPGFGYLTSPTWLFEVPRRSSPRTRVPTGAVGLAGGFSGVYPGVSPGGWQLIGRTELTMFDPARDPAGILRPGVRVHFVDESGPA